jgi:hypothetical protein
MISSERLDWMAATAKLKASEGSASLWDKDVAKALAELLEKRQEADNDIRKG